MSSNNKLVCLVGMPGAGKSEVSDYLMSKRDFGYIRFGQVVLDKVKETGQKPTEVLEREIREGIRKEYGMAAMAILNAGKIDQMLEAKDVLVDGLRSIEEYVFLKERYGDRFIDVAVHAPPAVRYQRLATRGQNYIEDKDLKFRSFTVDESKKRDIAEAEGLHMGTTIAMADYVVINNCSKAELQSQIDELLTVLIG